VPNQVKRSIKSREADRPLKKEGREWGHINEEWRASQLSVYKTGERDGIERPLEADTLKEDVMAARRARRLETQTNQRKS